MHKVQRVDKPRKHLHDRFNVNLSSMEDNNVSLCPALNAARQYLSLPKKPVFELLQTVLLRVSM